MRRILILGTLPAGRWRDRSPAGERDCRLVSTSPWLSAQLAAAGIAHRRVDDYFTPAGWEEIHAAAARTVTGLQRRCGRPPDPTWLDDWSHLIVDELRGPVFWARVAQALLRRERPRAIHVQQVAPTSAAASAVAALRAALVARDRACTPWAPP